VVAVSSGYLAFTFLRDDASEASGVTLSVESGTDLINWPDVFVIGPSASSSITENGAAPDTITVNIPRDTAARIFARLKVTIAP
jgi:hypothetical protein